MYKNRRISLHNDKRKKMRGQRRKLDTLINSMDKFIPFTRTGEVYEHFLVPSDMFIERNKTSGKVKREFCEKWLETTEKFIMQKPEHIPFCKVVVLFAVPNFWSSQIIIFYDEQYYNTFWDRKGPYQTWTPIDDRRSFCREQYMETQLSEKGYHETIVDEDFTFEGELWYYGELPYNHL